MSLLTFENSKLSQSVDIDMDRLQRKYANRNEFEIQFAHEEKDLDLEKLQYLGGKQSGYDFQLNYGNGVAVDYNIDQFLKATRIQDQNQTFQDSIFPPTTVLPQSTESENRHQRSVSDGYYSGLFTNHGTYKVSFQESHELNDTMNLDQFVKSPRSNRLSGLAETAEVNGKEKEKKSDAEKEKEKDAHSRGSSLKELGRMLSQVLTSPFVKKEPGDNASPDGDVGADKTPTETSHSYQADPEARQELAQKKKELEERREKYEKQSKKLEAIDENKYGYVGGEEEERGLSLLEDRKNLINDAQRDIDESLRKLEESNEEVTNQIHETYRGILEMLKEQEQRAIEDVHDYTETTKTQLLQMSKDAMELGQNVFEHQVKAKQALYVPRKEMNDKKSQKTRKKFKEIVKRGLHDSHIDLHIPTVTFHPQWSYGAVHVQEEVAMNRVLNDEVTTWSPRHSPRSNVHLTPNLSAQDNASLPDLSSNLSLNSNEQDPESDMVFELGAESSTATKDTKSWIEKWIPKFTFLKPRAATHIRSSTINDELYGETDDNKEKKKEKAMSLTLTRVTSDDNQEDKNEVNEVLHTEKEISTEQPTVKEQAVEKIPVKDIPIKDTPIEDTLIEDTSIKEKEKEEETKVENEKEVQMKVENEKEVQIASEEQIQTPTEEKKKKI